MHKSIILAALVIAAPCLADPDVTITNWIPGYRYIAATNEDVGTTGIETGTAYVCFPLADLTFLTAADAAHTNGDIRALQFALVKEWYSFYSVAPTNNPAPARLTISENISYDPSTNADIRFKLSLDARMRLSATGVTIADE